MLVFFGGPTGLDSSGEGWDEITVFVEPGMESTGLDSSGEGLDEITVFVEPGTGTTDTMETCTVVVSPSDVDVDVTGQ